jgi:hypothetical protein
MPNLTEARRQEIDVFCYIFESLRSSPSSLHRLLLFQRQPWTPVISWHLNCEVEIVHDHFDPPIALIIVDCSKNSLHSSRNSSLRVMSSSLKIVLQQCDDILSLVTGDRLHRPNKRLQLAEASGLIQSLPREHRVNDLRSLIYFTLASRSENGITRLAIIILQQITLILQHHPHRMLSNLRQRLISPLCIPPLISFPHEEISRPRTLERFFEQSLVIDRTWVQDDSQNGRPLILMLPVPCAVNDTAIIVDLGSLAPASTGGVPDLLTYRFHECGVGARRRGRECGFHGRRRSV